MDTDITSLQNKCENLMNIVVESRKRFGKMCVDYEKKTSLMENKLLNLRIDTFANYKFKPKNPVEAVNEEDDIVFEDFKAKYLEYLNRFETVKRKVKNTQEVVHQLKSDSVGTRLREPLNADVMLAEAKGQKV